MEIKTITLETLDQIPSFDFMARDEKIEIAVKNVLKDIINKGDAAVIDYTEKFDGVKLDTLKVSKEEIAEAYMSIDESFIDILKEAIENVKTYHEYQLPKGFEIEKGTSIMGQRILPIERVGLYVPGGKAPYPSTVIMCGIPAIIAGVKEIVMTTPPGKNGKVNANILVTADLLGIDEIYKVGGAQAVGALAFGTDTIKPVYKIVGPGNAYVAEAKRQVFGKVDIDMIAGPSEVLIIADDSADPDFIAADLMAQGEHDEMAKMILLSPSKTLLENVTKSIDMQFPQRNRKEILATSLENELYLLQVNSIDDAIAISNKIAPEHLEIMLDNPIDYLDKIENAGSIFLGKYTPESLGDYFAGPNHTLPTSGTATYASPLGVYDYIKRSSYINFSEIDFKSIYKKVETFANKEELDAHGYSAKVRFEK